MEEIKIYDMKYGGSFSVSDIDMKRNLKEVISDLSDLRDHIRKIMEREDFVLENIDVNDVMNANVIYHSYRIHTKVLEDEIEEYQKHLLNEENSDDSILNLLLYSTSQRMKKIREMVDNQDSIIRRFLNSYPRSSL